MGSTRLRKARRDYTTRQRGALRLSVAGSEAVGQQLTQFGIVVETAVEQFVREPSTEHDEYRQSTAAQLAPEKDADKYSINTRTFGNTNLRVGYTAKIPSSIEGY